tara:strand:- start:796 stop:1758 length:963 start_codon:yes stop_codon:yes gene_type:complete
MKSILVTGSSGFIGMHLCKSLLDDKYRVFGIDNMNDYYNPLLKEARLRVLEKYQGFVFRKGDISDLKFLNLVFEEATPDIVVNLAAQAGVRYSIKYPHEYMKSNILGFMNVLEACKKEKVKGLVYASSSSVYGGNFKIPFSETDRTDSPYSIYAASKKANELMAHSYSHLYGLNTTGLRFFTVYGPWGRPDMAIYRFTDRILNEKKISVYNNGKMKRDFTFIDDIIIGLKNAIKKNYRCEVFNLGNNKSENLMDLIGCIEKTLKKPAKIDFLKMQLGDVKNTFADIEHSKKMLNFNPSTSIQEGIPKFIDWFISNKSNIG